jgi:hypothetical protein
VELLNEALASNDLQAPLTSDEDADPQGACVKLAGRSLDNIAMPV